MHEQGKLSFAILYTLVSHVILEFMRLGHQFSVCSLMTDFQLNLASLQLYE